MPFLKKKNTYLLPYLICLLFSQSSFAGLISHQVDFSTQFSHHINESTDEGATFSKAGFHNKFEQIYLPHFDNSLGTLTGVSFDFSASYIYTLFLTVSDYDELRVNGQGYYYKTQGNSAIYSAFAPVINGTYLNEYNATRIPAFNTHANTSCLDAKMDKSHDLLQCQKGSRNLNGVQFDDTFDWYKDNLSPFLGNDKFTLDLYYFNTHNVLLKDGSSAVSELDMRWQGSVKVNYNFIDATEVPEPTNLAIFVLCMLPLIKRSFRR